MHSCIVIVIGIWHASLCKAHLHWQTDVGKWKPTFSEMDLTFTNPQENLWALINQWLETLGLLFPKKEVQSSFGCPHSKPRVECPLFKRKSHCSFRISVNVQYTCRRSILRHPRYQSRSEIEELPNCYLIKLTFIEIKWCSDKKKGVCDKSKENHLTFKKEKQNCPEGQNRDQTQSFHKKWWSKIVKN